MRYFKLIGSEYVMELEGDLLPGMESLYLEVEEQERAMSVQKTEIIKNEASIFQNSFSQKEKNRLSAITKLILLGLTEDEINSL